MRKMKLKSDAIMAFFNGLAFETVDFIFYVKEIHYKSGSRYQIYMYDMLNHETTEIQHNTFINEEDAVKLAFHLSSQYEESNEISKRIEKIN